MRSMETNHQRALSSSTSQRAREAHSARHRLVTNCGIGTCGRSPSLDGVNGDPDRTFDLTLSRGRGQSYTWTIDGQAYPDADSLQIRPGEHVRIRMTNQSPVVHPMHLHGHFFQVGNAIKDTVIVPGHRGQVTIDFHADNPGRWLFHCHNLYHLDAGMARVVRYVE